MEAAATLMKGVSADIMDRLDRMAKISESPDHLTRRCYTPEHRQVNALASAWMERAGMKVRQDEVGNVVGRYEGKTPGAPAIMLGSHLDSVVMAGKYDGPLGVLSAIDCVQSLSSRGVRLDYAVEVACFADEEGVRFQSTYLGSRGIAGTFDLGLLDRQDKDGISLAEAMTEFGLDVSRIPDAARKPEEIHCYIEVHIEQGPVLENEDLAVAAVSAISGANRMTVTIDGNAGHAGTVPMSARQDALSAAAEAILLVESIGRANKDAVATVGQMAVEPGATNVIPGKATFSVDLRAADDTVRRKAAATLESGLNDLAARRGVAIQIDKSHEAQGVTSAPWVLAEIEGAMSDLSHPVRRLPSGAGHDAAAMAAITDIAMIFVRCKGGISHHPDESITQADAIAGAELLLRTVERIGGLKL